MPDRNGKIFYTSITSLSHISKEPGHEAVDAKFDGRNINERISWSRQMWAVFDESTNIVPK